MLFNTLFTSLPVIFMGIFDKDLNASTLIAIPELYTIGQRNAGFNIKVYLGWMLMATAECTLIFYIALTLYGRAPFTPDNTIFPLGIITYSAVVCLVSIKMQYVPPHFLCPSHTQLTINTFRHRFIETYKKTYMNLIAILISIGGWFLFQIFLSAFNPFKVDTWFIRGAFLFGFGKSLVWWLPFILILSAVVLLELGFQSTRIACWPSDEDVFRALEKDPEVKRRFEEAASSELQMGWDRAKEGDKKVEGEGEQEKREREVQEILELRGDGEARQSGGSGDARDVDRVFSQGYGDVR
jgi:phospholipid-translocating ATPase